MLLSFLAIAVLAPPPGGDSGLTTLVAAVAIGALFGFLRYNSYKAMVFMGDAGSTPLGFVLAVTGILFIREANGAAASPILLVPLIGLPIVDTAQVIVVRLLHGRSPFAADRSHLHHRLFSLGLRHGETVLVLYGLHASLTGTALILRDAPEVVIALVFVAHAVIAVACIQGAALLGWRFRPEGDANAMDELTVSSAKAGVERRNQWLRRRRWLPSVSAALVRAAIVAFLVFGALIPGEVPPGLAVAALLAALLVLMEERGLVSVGGFGVSQLGLFAAALTACHLMSQGPHWAGSQAGWLVLGFGLGLAGLLALAIRLTRRQIFPLSTLDGLVVLVALVLMAGIVAGGVPLDLGGPAIAVAALFYGCEFVLVHDAGQLRLVQLASIASLVIVGSRGLLA
jgi:UDP-GlcNAc:undecaprenyl-phosphate GlcNAc-1-phosphate transferase